MSTEAKRRPDRTTTVGKEKGGGSQRKRRRPAWSSSPSNLRPYESPPDWQSVPEVPPERLKRAYEKFGWIQAFVSQGCPRGMLVPFAEDYSRFVMKGAPVPPYTTLNTWANAYKQFGILGLVDSIRSDAGRIERLHPKHQRQLEAYILGKGDRSPRAALDWLINVNSLVEPSGHDRSSVPRFPTEEDPQFVPTYYTVRTWMRRFEAENPHPFTVASEGLKGFRSGHRLWLPSHLVPAGQRLALDSTPADIVLRRLSPEDPTRWEMCRPAMTLVEDVGSRTMITFNLSFEPVSADILLSVMRRAFLQEANFPGLISSGVPQELVIDGGSEYEGAFKAEMKRLGVEVLESRSYEPTHNAKAERVIGTVSRSLLPQLPGYSKRESPYAEHRTPDRELRRNPKYETYKLEVPIESLLTIEEFEEKLLAWSEVYNHSPHSALRADCPDVREAVRATATSAKEEA
ncbi:MAG: hypothetical protein EA398_16715 [Deltaproteobacteria bacterium]|nr:MAG: hypothetical protein EA398_16715 [Deltaproteobacteria bacterium]